MKCLHGSSGLLLFVRLARFARFTRSSFRFFFNVLNLGYEFIIETNGLPRPDDVYATVWKHNFKIFFGFKLDHLIQNYDKPIIIIRKIENDRRNEMPINLNIWRKKKQQQQPRITNVEEIQYGFKLKRNLINQFKNQVFFFFYGKTKIKTGKSGKWSYFCKSKRKKKKEKTQIKSDPQVYYWHLLPIYFMPF